MKKWHRLRQIIEDAGIKVKESEEPIELFNSISQVYKTPKVSFRNEYVIVDGIQLNLNKFPLKVCLSIESRGQLNQNIFSIAVNETARRSIIKDSLKYNKKLETRTKITITDSLVMGNTPSKVFYNLPEWQRLRYSAIEKYGNKCNACGRSPKDGVIIHVDHIKPRSISPELALDIDNLQILCEQCNLGKSNKFDTDWRAA